MQLCRENMRLCIQIAPIYTNQKYIRGSDCETQTDLYKSSIEISPCFIE